MYHLLGSGFEKLCQLLDHTNVGLADAPLDLTISQRNTTLGSISQHDCLPPPGLHTVPPFPDSVSCNIAPPPAHSKICVPPGFPASEPTTAPLTANLQMIGCGMADPANTFAVSLQDAFPESSIPDHILLQAKPHATDPAQPEPVSGCFCEKDISVPVPQASSQPGTVQAPLQNDPPDLQHLGTTEPPSSQPDWEDVLQIAHR